MLGMDAQFNIISYVVISTKYDSNSKLLDSFLPLVEHALFSIDKNYVEEVNINDTYEEIYGYRIHSAILNQLLRILQRQGKIEKLKNECIQINKETLKSYSIKEEHDFKLRALLSDVDIFCRKKGHSFERNVISKGIIEFLQKNAIEFNSFINYQSNMEIDDEVEELFIDLTEFLLEERKNDTVHYKFMKEIFAGIVLSSIIISNEQFVSSSNEEFRIGNALLDSNYIFRLLDLQTSLEHQAAQDTYEALSDMGCTFWVCKDTIKQIADTIRSFSTYTTETTNTVLRSYGEEGFTGLASAFIRRSLTSAKLELIIDELEDILVNKYKVRFVDENIFNIDLIDINSDEFNSLQEVKLNSSSNGIAHDLLLVHVVNSNRPKSLYKADQANWWVLTDDNRLTNWNVKNSHKNVPECITEAQLATVMWLCNPKKASLDGFFNTVIAFKSQGLVTNGDYVKISKEIERQKERLSGDEPKLKKLSLVLSQRLLSIQDLLSEDSEEVDHKFDQMLSESQENFERSQKKIAEQEQSIRSHITEKDNLSRAFNDTKSLLSIQTEKLIKSLTDRKNDKQTKYDSFTNQAIALDSKKTNRVRVTTVCLGVLLFLLLLRLLFCALPFIDSLDYWYSEHQMLFWFLSIVVSAGASWLGTKLKFVSRFLKWVSEAIIIKFFVKLKILKDIDAQIKRLYDRSEELLEEMSQIQDEIDKELTNV